MNVSRSHFSLNRGLFVSVAVHVLPFALVAALTHFKPVVPQRQTDVLQVELFGMVSGQQVAGREAVATVEEQAAIEEQSAAALPQQEEVVAPPEPPRPEEQKSVPNAPKPVPVRAQQQSAPAPRRQSVPASPKQEAREGRAQQTIGKHEQDTSASQVRQYLAELTRIVRNRQTYPLKAKAKGWMGVTVVAFTVSEGGSVVSGSEAVRKTSGYDELDQAALSAVRNTGHLPSPPHTMEVVVAFYFNKNDL